MKNCRKKNHREGHEFHSCRFRLREKIRLAAAGGCVVGVTTLFSSRNLFPYVLYLASSQPVSRRSVCPVISQNSFSLPPRRPLSLARLRRYARPCASLAYSGSRHNHRARRPVNQGRILARARYSDWTKIRSLAARIYGSSDSRRSGLHSSSKLCSSESRRCPTRLQSLRISLLLRLPRIQIRPVAPSG
jgi:hypothetical protein